MLSSSNGLLHPIPGSEDKRRSRGKEARKALPKGTLNLNPVPNILLYIGNGLGTGNSGLKKVRKNATFRLEKAGMPLEMPEQAFNRIDTVDFNTFGGSNVRTQTSVFRLFTPNRPAGSVEVPELFCYRYLEASWRLAGF